MNDRKFWEYLGVMILFAIAVVGVYAVVFGATLDPAEVRQRQTIELIDATVQVDIGSYEVKASGCDAEYRAVCLAECQHVTLLAEVYCEVKDEPIDCSGYTPETPYCKEHITCICVGEGKAK
jgi:hypothetical protein